MILIIIFSLLLDNVFSLLISQNSFFLPLFTLLSIIIYFSYDLKYYKYFLLSSTVGLMCDIIFTDTLFLNAGIFLLFSLIVYLIFKKLNYNLINVILVSLLLIIFYRIITYFLFLSNFGISFNIFTLLESIYSSIIINVIYIIFFYSIRSKRINSSK